MRRLERERNLARNRQRLFEIERATRVRDPCGQGDTGDELHDECPRAIRFLETVNDRNVGMVQRGEHLGLALKAGQPVGIAGEASGRIFRATSRPSFVSRAR